MRSITIVVLVAAITAAGCTSSTKSVQPSAALAPVSMSTLAGHWQGYVTSGGNSSPMDVQVNPDGTYVSRLGAFTGTGTMQIENGTIYSVGQLSGPTQGPGKSELKLSQKNGRDRLTGEGRSENGTPYSFEINRR